MPNPLTWTGTCPSGPSREVTSSPGYQHRPFRTAAVGIAESGQVVMVRETQPVVTVFQVPLGHVIRRRVAVAVSRMCVKVALEPFFELP